MQNGFDLFVIMAMFCREAFSVMLKAIIESLLHLAVTLLQQVTQKFRCLRAQSCKVLQIKEAELSSEKTPRRPEDCSILARGVT